LQLTRQSHSLEKFASGLEFLGYNLTRLEEYGRLVLFLNTFTLMRAAGKFEYFHPHASAGKKDDTSPWVKQLPLRRLIIDVIRLGHPHVVEQTLIHVTNSFLEAPLTVWAH